MNDVQVDLRVEILQVQRWRNDPALQRQNGQDRFDRADRADGPSAASEPVELGTKRALGLVALSVILAGLVMAAL